MLFNSFVFVGFFAVVYAAYLALQPRYRAQNVLLLVASYVFYGWWDWRFLSLIAASTLVDYLVGAALGSTPGNASSRRRTLLGLSLATNLGLLGFFKYFDFFVDSAADLMALLGMRPDLPTLSIVLPVGISFYTFQTLSYTIDVYRGSLRPTRNLVEFALYVSFFPQLVAGPIERAAHLLPQMQRPRALNAEQVNAGIYLLLQGYFKKVVIADRLGLIADGVFNQHTEYQGLALVVGVLAFSGQIYGDFSGYSDIARGLARLMGFDLMVNFRNPYFALDPTDFWNRWHISLSTWLRDYLYIPLGGNRDGVMRTYRNLAITMLLGGLWHGAAWNFVAWGAFHGLILIAYRLVDPPPWRRDVRAAPAARVFGMWLLMTLLTQFGWLLFRARSLDQIGWFLTRASLFPGPEGLGMAARLMLFSLPLVALELWQYRSRDLLVATRLRMGPRALLYGLMIAAIMLFGVRESTEFIYFQF